MRVILTTGLLSKFEDENSFDIDKKSRRCKQRDALTEEQKDLAAQYMPLAKSLAQPLKRSWPKEREEFDSAACLALVEAAQSFDPSRNVKFSTFARYRIWGALRDVQRALVVSGWKKDQDSAPFVGSLHADAEEYGSVLGCEPDPPVGEELEAIDFVEKCIQKLPPKHAEACRQIYIHGRSQGEAAVAVGCSKSRLSYLHKEALEMLNDSWTYKSRPEADANNLSNR